MKLLGLDTTSLLVSIRGPAHPSELDTSQCPYAAWLDVDIGGTHGTESVLVAGPLLLTREVEDLIVWLEDVAHDRCTSSFGTEEAALWISIRGRGTAGPRLFVTVRDPVAIVDPLGTDWELSFGMEVQVDSLANAYAVLKRELDAVTATSATSLAS